MTSAPLGKRPPQNQVFRMETLERHAKSGACLQIPIVEAECGEVKIRKTVRIEPLILPTSPGTRKVSGLTWHGTYTPRSSLVLEDRK